MKNHNSKLRPISPHLMVYQPQITSVLSIYHRITGVSLALLYLSIPILLTLIQSNPLSFQPGVLSQFHNFFPVFYGIYSLFLILLSYHFFNGLRHLGWDFGQLLSSSQLLPLDIKRISRSGILVLSGVFLIFLRILFS